MADGLLNGFLRLRGFPVIIVADLLSDREGKYRLTCDFRGVYMLLDELQFLFLLEVRSIVIE